MLTYPTACRFVADIFTASSYSIHTDRFWYDNKLARHECAPGICTDDLSMCTLTCKGLGKLEKHMIFILLPFIPVAFHITLKTYLYNRLPLLHITSRPPPKNLCYNCRLRVYLPGHAPLPPFVFSFSGYHLVHHFRRWYASLLSLVTMYPHNTAKIE
jgi:hypothetical protein